MQINYKNRLTFGKIRELINLAEFATPTKDITFIKPLSKGCLMLARRVLELQYALNDLVNLLYKHHEKDLCCTNQNSIQTDNPMHNAVVKVRRLLIERENYE